MTQPAVLPSPPDPLVQLAREAAAKSTDPHEVELLVRSAEKIENAERQLLESQASLLEAVEKGKAEAVAIRRSNHLPTWVVALVLTSLVAFLVFVAVKHHV